MIVEYLLINKDGSVSSHETDKLRECVVLISGTLLSKSTDKNYGGVKTKRKFNSHAIEIGNNSYIVAIEDGADIPDDSTINKLIIDNKIKPIPPGFV